MKGLSYITDLLVAGLILMVVVGLIAYAQGYLTPKWENIYKLKLIASDAAYYLSSNIDKVETNCHAVMSNIIPSYLNYRVELNGKVLCEKGDIKQANKVASGIAYGAYENKPLDDKSDNYYYKTCKATDAGTPVYRCNINSQYTRNEIQQPVKNGIVKEGVVVVRVFV